MIDVPARAYLVAKALRRNEDLSNRELDRRMRNPVRHVQPIAGAVPGGSDIVGAFNAERGFRIRRGANKREARKIQRSEQRQRLANVPTGIALGVAGGAAGSPKQILRTRKLKDPRKTAIAGAAAAAGAGYGLAEGRRRAKVERAVWRRMLAKRPEDAS